MWIGSGDSPAALRRVGQLAEGWLPTPAIARGRGFEEAWDQVRRHADQAGRPATAITVEGHVRMRQSHGIEALRRHVEGWRAAVATAWRSTSWPWTPSGRRATSNSHAPPAPPSKEEQADECDIQPPIAGSMSHSSAWPLL
jgi:hypothetical protein